jgi:hypothetical protein
MARAESPKAAVLLEFSGLAPLPALPSKRRVSMIRDGVFRATEKTMKAWTLTCLGAALLVASGLAILPRGVEGARLLSGPRDEVAVAHYALAGKTAADYQAAAEQALAAGDEDLAASVIALSVRNGMALPPALAAKVRAAQEDAAARIGEDVWNGFLSGDAPNEAALAGAVAADLTGVGDIRDLYQEAVRYVNGEAVDGLTVGLATLGLGLTAATVASLGLTLPERAGLSTLKAVRRTGKLSPALARQVGATAASAMDGTALRAVSASLARLDIAAARQAAGRVVKPAALRTLKEMGTDVATIGRNAGYRATVQTLGVANSTAEVSRVAKLSGRFGTATRAVLALGGAAFTFASLAASAVFWSVSLIVWSIAALAWIGSLGLRIGRWFWRVPSSHMIPRSA